MKTPAPKAQAWLAKEAAPLGSFNIRLDGDRGGFTRVESPDEGAGADREPRARLARTAPNWVPAPTR